MSGLLSLRLRKTLAWLALCAMCFGSAAPTVSRWLAAAAQAADLVEVCDAHGITLVPASVLQAQAQDQGQRNGGSPAGHHGSGEQGDSCSYCTLLHHSPGVPATAAGFAPHAPLLAAQTSPADVSAPALRAVRRPQMPQAPPRAVA